MYSIKQGIRGLLSTKGMSFLSIISVSVSLIILSLVMSAILNLNEFIEYTKNEVNEVRVSVVSELTKDELDKLKSTMNNIAYVDSISYKSKETAFDEMKESWDNESYLLDGLDNPLDDYYIVKISDSTQIDFVASELEKIESVIGVNYHQEIMENFLDISETIKRFGGILIIFLFIICIVLISNTIKSRVYSKREEIQIIKCFGGSNTFIIAPFVVEGFFIGTIGSLIASGSFSFAYNHIIDNVNTLLGSISTSTLLGMDIILISVIPVLIFSGVIIGILGSIISVKKYLK
ncbi:MAG: permease-like cell division protein FtsX [Peptostreptococcaceae bacterium]